MFSLLLFRPYLPRSQASVFGSRDAMGRMAWGLGTIEEDSFMYFEFNFVLRPGSRFL